MKVITPESEFDRWSDMGLNDSDILNNMLVLESNMSKILHMQETMQLQYGYTVTYRPASFLIKLSKFYRNGRPVYHIVEECFLPTISSYAITIDFPFGRRIERYQRRIIESGIPQFWDTLSKFEYTSIVPFQYQREIKYDKSVDVIALTMTHVQVIFYALGVGLLISSFVFVIEKFKGTNK